MNKRRVIIISLTIWLLSIATIVTLTYFHVQEQILMPFNSSAESEQEFVVEKGDGINLIAYKLEKAKLIAGAEYFQIYVWQNDLAKNIQAGRYNLSPSMAIPKIMEIFSDGKIISKEIKITVPEGFLVEEIDKRLADLKLIDEKEFIAFDKKGGLDYSKFEFLNDKPRYAGLEGYYFPDTYKYYKDSTVEEVAIKMLDNFGKKFTPELREELKRQNKTIFETVVLASIIEKEAGSKEDMGKISSVFHNRLNIGKKLESDATINYVIKKNRAQATYEDLKLDSPYNTYKNFGLPPTPISNPGIDAIKAAIYPENTDYFYFLTKRNDSRAVFSKTYEEHLFYKNKYLN